jgi:hypothetical protein
LPYHRIAVSVSVSVSPYPGNIAVGLPGREERFFDQGAKIVGANTEYVKLTPMLALGEETWLFSVELDTMRVEREHERNKYKGAGYPCELPWPTVLPNHVRRARH